MNKTKTIEQIISLTNKRDTDTFDKLSDKSDEYLKKLVKIIKQLK